MTPSIDIRLKSIVSAMEDIIIPAIAHDDSLPLQQASLVVQHIQIISEQLPKLTTFENLCLNDIIATATAIRELPEFKADAAAATVLAESLNYPSGTGELAYSAIARNLETLVESIHAYGKLDLLEKIAVLVLEFSERQTLRERVWFAATGLDPMAFLLPKLDELLPSGAPA